VEILDTGSTFGGAGHTSNDSTASMNLVEWQHRPVFRKTDGGECHGDLTVSLKAGGGESNPLVSEEGRLFLLEQLRRLTPDRIHAIFAAARVDQLEYRSSTPGVESIDAWARAQWAAAPERAVLVYSTASPQAVAAAQAKGGGHDVGARLERILAAVARRLVEHGARRLVVAGGETSGACVQALGVSRLRIGAQIDPGVPWCHAAPALAPQGMHLALKSGNFGGIDFFARAFTVGP